MLLSLLIGHAGPALAAPPDSDAALEAWSYRVQPGDTLYALAGTYLREGVGWASLQRLNRVPNPRRLPPGRELRLPIDWLRGEASVATLAFAQGPVSRELEGGASSPVAVGDTLRAGDVLSTPPGSDATLRLVDGTRLLVSGGSRLRIDTLLVLAGSGAVRADFRLLGGEADTRVVPRPDGATQFRVRTPVLTLGVRGTDFRVGLDPAAGAVRTEVTEGKVAAQLAPPPAAASAPSPPAAASAPSPSAAASVPPPAASGPVLSAGQGVRRAPGDSGPLAPRALSPAPLLDTLPARIERLPLDFAWPAGGASTWRAQVYADAALERRLLDGRFEQPRARWADLPDGRYVLAVRSVDADGLEGGTAVRAFEVDVRPEPPFTREPAPDARIYGAQAKLVWTASAAAQRYRLQVAATPDFSGALALDRADLDAAELALPLSPGRWHWRLASIAPDGEQGPWGDALGFELREIPASPQDLSASSAEDGTRTFRWRARDAGEKYDVQLARVEFGADPKAAAAKAFEQPLQERRLERAELVLEALPPGRYLLRVRTVDADGYAGPYGPVQSFDVPRPSPWGWILPVVGAVLLLL